MRGGAAVGRPDRPAVRTLDRSVYAGGDDRLDGDDHPSLQRRVQPPVEAVGYRGRLVDALSYAVTTEPRENREALSARGGLYDAADLVDRTARPRHRGRPDERQLRAVPQFLVHPRPRRQGDR